METLISILTLIGFILLGFLIAEFQNAHLGKQVKDNSKLYFKFVGVEFTEKDIQRLFFSLLLGAGVMIMLPYIATLINYELNGKLVYIVTGYSPSLIMFLVKKKLKKLGDSNDNLKSSILGGGNDIKKEQK